MKRINLTFLVIALAFSFTNVKAQNGTWCGTDIIDQQEVEKDPSILDRRAELEDFTKKFIENKSKEDELIIIPVVFHVVHDYGPENISLERIEGAIETINKDFSATNSEIGQVIPEFQDIIANSRIEFRLAKLDPDGNCTQGVTRTHSMATYEASNYVKYEVPGWNPSMYLNIWVVNSIPGSTAAWSHYPGVSPALDGIVSAYNYVSSSSHTLSHEIGHYLNLAHPWGSTNDPNVPENCNTDDNVEDTPNTIGAAVGSCNKAQVSCGSLDNVQNHMDYSSCEAMFTMGQKDRMRAALNSGTSNRNNLWTEENLIATGTIDGYAGSPCEPIADFGWDENTGCQGITVAFFDNTYNSTVTSWNWDFEGGEPATSTEQNPSVYFPDAGEFNVSLTAANDDGTSTVLKEKIIVLHDTIQGIMYPYTEDFESENVLDPENVSAWTLVNEDAQNDGWDLVDLDGNKVLKGNLRLTYDGTISSVISPNINIADATDLTHFTFKVAYAKRLSSSNDELRVYLSQNCGKSWSLRYIKSGSTLQTNDGVLTSDFIPTEDQWSEERISLSNFENVNHFMVKFDVKSASGATIYLDDIKFGEVQSGISSDQYFNNIRVFPNPAKGNATLKIYSNINDQINVNIINASGMKVFSNSYSVQPGANTINLDELEKFNKGIYFVQVINSYNIHTQRLILY